MTPRTPRSPLTPSILAYLRALAAAPEATSHQLAVTLGIPRKEATATRNRIASRMRLSGPGQLAAYARIIFPGHPQQPASTPEAAISAARTAAARGTTATFPKYRPVPAPQAPHAPVCRDCGIPINKHAYRYHQATRCKSCATLARPETSITPGPKAMRFAILAIAARRAKRAAQIQRRQQREAAAREAAGILPFDAAAAIPLEHLPRTPYPPTVRSGPHGSQRGRPSPPWYGPPGTDRPEETQAH